MRDSQGYSLENIPHASWAFTVLGTDFKQVLNPSAHRSGVSHRAGMVLLVFYGHSG